MLDRLEPCGTSAYIYFKSLVVVGEMTEPASNVEPLPQLDTTSSHTNTNERDVLRVPNPSTDLYTAEKETG